MSRVVAPPFDVIDQDTAALLRNRDPHNVVRLILGKQGPGGRGEEEYRRAGETLAAWRSQDVLIREDTPAVYVCEQTFTLDEHCFVRHGVICAMLLEDFSSEQVLPHERTMVGPKTDRFRLMKACRANLSPVFGVFSDTDGRGDALLEEMQQGEPLYELCTPAGVTCKLHRVTDPTPLRQLGSLLRAERLFIADGHHRYETALRYRDECRSLSGPPGSAPEDFVLMFAVSVKNAGLKTLPVHRLVKAAGAFDVEALLAAVGEHFDIVQLPLSGPRALADLLRWREGADDEVACYLADGRFFVFSPKPGNLLQLLLPPGSRQWQQLAVTRLHYAIIEPVFGIPAEGASAHARILFSQDTDEVYWGVESRRFDAGFFLPAIGPATVEAVAQRGERMPPKSTFFYPKIDSGLVFLPFEEGDSPPCIPGG